MIEQRTFMGVGDSIPAMIDDLDIRVNTWLSQYPGATIKSVAVSSPKREEENRSAMFSPDDSPLLETWTMVEVVIIDDGG